jgi:hypothetical protein
MMKKLLFLGLAFSASVGVSSAQKARQIVAQTGPVALIKADRNGKTATASTKDQPTPNNQKTNVTGSFGIKVGKSYYDLPSNSSVPNRVLRHNDGTVSVVWTETCYGPQSPGFSTRGVGYNYFDGTAWKEGATSRPKEFQGTCGYPASQANYGIASKRVGWPEIVSVGGNEMVFTHDVGISVTKRPAKGTGGMTAWSNTTDLAFTQNIGGVTGNNGTWPRVVANGNTIHMIYTINNTPLPKINGVSGIVVYSRSTDGGTTWDKQNIQLPGLTYANGYDRLGGDAYALAVNGQTVAIAAGGAGDPWTVWKSINNGDTWTRNVLKTVVPADTVGNTIIAPDASTGLLDTTYSAFVNDDAHALVIDNNGNVHAFAGEIRVAVRDTLGALRPTFNGTWYPYSGRAILHWTDKAGAPTTPSVIAELENPIKPISWVLPTGKNGGGIAPYGGVGLLSMPNAAVNAAGDVYLVYSGVMAGTSHTSDSTGQPFRDLYLTKFKASTNTWIPTEKVTNISRKLDIYGDSSSTAEQLEESVFPSVHHFVESDGILHMTWMSDDKPGMTLGRDEDPEKENSIMYLAMDVEKMLGKKKDMAAFVNEIKAYPNPTSGKIAINVDLKKSANVKVRVTNIMGQEVASIEAGKLATGKNTVSVDMSNFANGVYLYTVYSDNFTGTNRIVKQ